MLNILNSKIIVIKIGSSLLFTEKKSLKLKWVNSLVSDISKLIKPILQGSHEIVVGKRPIMKIDDFSISKKILQKIGSVIVSKIAGVHISDTTSGFRAFSRNTAFSISTVTDFTYTLETIIVSGRRKIPITEVPIEVNGKQRESRLFRNVFEYILKSVVDIIFISISIQPLRIFGSIGIIFFIIGILIGLRFIILSNFSNDFGEGFGHIQSLILASILLTTGFSSFLFGLIAKQISGSRILAEKLFTNQRKKDLANVNNLNDLNIIYVKTEKI